MTSDEPNLTYYFDFLRKIKSEYPPASWYAILEDIRLAQDAGPTLSGLKLNEAGFYEMLVPIGWGHKALIELEFDRSGVLQPVMGGVIES